MIRKSIDKAKSKSKKSERKLSVAQPLSNEVNLTIFLSQGQSIDMSIPLNCPLKIINSLLLHKVSEFKKQELIGFETVPADYKFDFRLSQNIGNLTSRKPLTLHCLFKNSGLEELIKYKGEREEKQQCNPQQEKYWDTPAALRQLDIRSFYKINKYKVCKSLSSGGFSRVYLVRNLLTGKFFAAKFMEKSSQVNIGRHESIINEFKVHKSLSHPYIIEMEEYIETEEFYILIMEYCPGGELFTLLKNNRYMEEDKARVLYVQVLLAIQYLHDQSIIFRDIKPQNILIDAFGNAKLTDFGLAKSIRNRTNSYCGSIEYMAPEVVAKKPYSLEVDLYCMGALLYEVLVGCPPFYNPNFSNEETKFHICNSEVCFPRKVILTDEVRDLIESMLIKNPEQRFGFLGGVNEILQHPWFEGVPIDDFMNMQIECPFVPNLQNDNFDRQDDACERHFFKKIQEDMRYCKREAASTNVYKKFKFNPEVKGKSHSGGCLIKKKHMKSKSQGEPSNLEIQVKGNKSRNPSPKSFVELELVNPYKDDLLKSKSVFVSSKGGSKGNKSKALERPLLKKEAFSFSKSLLRASCSQSKSMEKNEAEADRKSKELGQSVLINSRSMSNSKKGSLHKNSVSQQFNRQLFKVRDHNNKISKLKEQNAKLWCKQTKYAQQFSKYSKQKENQSAKLSIDLVKKKSAKSIHQRFSTHLSKKPNGANNWLRNIESGKFKDTRNSQVEKQHSPTGKKGLKRKHVKNKSMKFQFATTLKTAEAQIERGHAQMRQTMNY